MSWFDPQDWLALRTSLEVAGIAVVFTLPVAVALSLSLSKGRFPGRIALEALTQAPLVLSPVVLGLVLLAVFGLQGPVGGLLYALFGVRLVFTTAGASLAAGLGALPLMVRCIRLVLDREDPRLDVAAASLGAGTLDRILTISLPLAWPGVLSAAVVGFAACLGEFGAVITFAGDIPGRTETLPLAIYGALNAPGGETRATHLALLSLATAAAAVVGAEAISRRRL